MDRQELQEVSQQSESNPEKAFSKREGLYEPFYSDDDEPDIFSKVPQPNPFNSGENDVLQNIAAEGIQNLIAYDRVAGEEIAEALATEAFIWNDHSRSFAVQIHTEYPDILPKIVAGHVESATVGGGQGLKQKLRVLQRFADVESSLLSSHIDELATLLDGRSSSASPVLNIFETLLEADSSEAERIVSILSDYIQGTGRFSGESTKNGFEPLAKAHPEILIDTTELIPTACSELRQSDRALYESRYLGRVGQALPREVLPKLVDTAGQIDKSRTLEQALRAINRIVSNTDSITDEEIATLQRFLSNPNESVVWQAAASFRAIGETQPERIEPFTDSLIECLRRASQGEFSQSDSGFSQNQVRDLEWGSLTFQLYHTLTHIAEERPQTVREALPYAIAELADPEKQLVSDSLSGFDRIKERAEVGPPSRQLLEAYIDYEPDYVFEKLLADLKGRDEYNQDQATVLHRAGQEAPETAAEQLDTILEINERTWSNAKNPCPYLLQEIAQKAPSACEDESTVSDLLNNIGRSEKLDTAIGRVLVEIDNSYLEPHLHDLTAAVQSDMGMPNTLVALERCLSDDIDAADQALIECSEKLFELLDADDESIRFVATRGLLPVARQSPELFNGQIGTLIYRLEQGSEPETETIIFLLRLLVEEYTTEVAAARSQIRAALGTVSNEGIRVGCALLSKIGEVDDIPKLEQVRDSLDDSDLQSEIDETIDAIKERAAESETSSDQTEAGPKPDDSPIDWEDITLWDRIARTNSATIYEATLDRDDKTEQIALKELFYHGGLTEEAIDDFHDEIKNWQAVDDNPYVVDLLGWGTDPDPWIAMERMDIGTLRELQNDSVPADQAVWIGECLAAALHYTHHLGRPHYDIKPENILLTNEADAPWPVPKLADWGSAQLLVEQAGGVSGFTPEYAAPELLTDGEFESSDYRTDLYQLGIVLYELLTGQHPFPDRNVQSFGNDRAALEQLPDHPSSVSDVPPSVDKIILQCLEPQLTDRYQAARTLETDLRNVRIGSEIESTQSLAELATLYTEVTRSKRDKSVRKCHNWARTLRAFVENHEVDDSEYEDTRNAVDELVSELQQYNEARRNQPLSKGGHLYSLVDDICFSVERLYERAHPVED